MELTHGGWVYEGFAVGSCHIIEADSLQYLWLPLSHVFGKALLACQLAIGFASAVDGRIDKIVPGLGSVHPSFMCGAPRIFEKVRAAVMLASPQGGMKGRIARWAFAVGRASREYRLATRCCGEADTLGQGHRAGICLLYTSPASRCRPRCAWPTRSRIVWCSAS